jgi:hypothetical protein
VKTPPLISAFNHFTDIFDTGEYGIEAFKGY